MHSSAISADDKWYQVEILLARNTREGIMYFTEVLRVLVIMDIVTLIQRPPRCKFLTGLLGGAQWSHRCVMRHSIYSLGQSRVTHEAYLLMVSPQMPLFYN